MFIDIISIRTGWLVSVCVLMEVFLLCVSAGCDAKAPINQTRSDLSAIYIAIIEVENSQKKPITKILDEKYPQVINYNAKLAAFLKEKRIVVPTSAQQNGQVEVVDQWGNPLLVYSRTDALKLSLPANLIGDQNLVIWSAGPNGTNELGQGDDIFVTERFARMR